MKGKDLKNDIVRAAYKAFAKADYKQVSTNQIVQDANVSKGLLFHYFKNKQTLYISLYEMAWSLIHRDIFTDFPQANHDAFDRLMEMIVRKTDSMIKHQTITAFIKRVHMNTMPDIVKARTQIYQSFQQRNYKRVFDQIDKSLFKDDQHLDEIFKVVTWTFNKITHDWERNHAKKEPSDALKILKSELEHYLVFFKTYFYKA